MKKIAAVTVNYNREKSTNNLIDSLRKSEIADNSLHIIVVDNAPQKPYFAPDKHKDNVTVIRSGTNTGFSGGNNIGIKEAINIGSDYILLVNDDTVVSRDLIKNLKEVLQSGDKIGVVSPKIYFAKGHEFHKERYKMNELGHILWFAGGFTDWKHAKSVHRGINEVDKGQFDTKERIEFATGCCMMVKAEVFEKVGFFDERYFLYYEDDDLCMRIRSKGFEIYYAPKAAMYHENASSSGGAGNVLHDYFLTRNQMLFGMKHAPFRTKIALIRQSLRLLSGGREYQKRGIKDFYLRKFGKGTFFDKQ